MKTYFLKKGNIYTASSDAALDLHDALPAGNYAVKFNPMAGFYVETVESFRLPSVIYGNTEKMADRILKTFHDRPSTTGVLLVGEKGSGKTLLAKMLGKRAAQLDIPTLIVNEPFSGDGFNTFLASITQPVVLLFDEFEKVYSDEDQQRMLTVLDGVFGGKKLYVMTANNKYKITLHMQNRPGRFYYFLEFGTLSYEFIREYCKKNLKDQAFTEQICVLSMMFNDFNFDMLQAVVEEVNRYAESPRDVLEFLNVKPSLSSSGRYQVTLKIKSEEIDKTNLHNEGLWSGNPFARKIEVYYDQKRAGDPDKAQYKSVVFGPSDLQEFEIDTGVFRYKKGSYHLTLAKAVSSDKDYREFL